MTLKKKKALLGALFGMTVLLAGGFVAGGLFLGEGNRIPVVEVSELSTGFFSDSGGSFGTVTTKANQEVYLDSDGLVTKVYVKPGDRVKVGDKILSYDTTLLELELEESTLEKQMKELELKGAEADLKKLQTVSPIPDPPKTTASVVEDDPEEVEGPSADSGDDANQEAKASLKQNTVVMTASSGVVVTEAESSESNGLALLEEQAPVSQETEPPAAEKTSPPTPETAPPVSVPETSPPPNTEAESITPGTSGNGNIPPVTIIPEIQEPETPGVAPIEPIPPETVSPGTGGEGSSSGGESSGKEEGSDGGDNGKEGSGEGGSGKEGSGEGDSGETGGEKPPQETEGVKETEPTSHPITVQETEALPDTEEIQEIGMEEEAEISPLGGIKAYRILDDRAKPYKGEGTKEKPYVFFCKDKAVIHASFMNKILGFNARGTSRKKGGMNRNGKGCYAILEIREGDDISGGYIKSIQINGTVPVEKAFAPDLTWTFSTNGMEKNVPVVIEEENPPDGEGDWIDPGFENWNDADVYTVSELKRAIREKQKEIEELKLEIRETDLKITKNQRKLEKATVVSSIHGVVKDVGDLKEERDDTPFIEITSDSGLYVRGTIDEFQLEHIKAGNRVNGYSYDSETYFDAEITEISTYPASLKSEGSSGNPNSSSYPYLAYIPTPGALKDGESVSLTLEDAPADEEILSLPRAYLRSENGQSYVYLQDADQKLKKQYVKTGRIADGSVEITAGLSRNDRIAFPYAPKIREGAKTKEGTPADEAPEEF